MRAFVFTDRALERHAGRFVWLSIDTEKSANAEFLERYPIRAYPTLLVIDPFRERAVLGWIGAATADQLEGLLRDAERSMRGGGAPFEERLARADRLLAAGRERKAAKSYRKALESAPDGWVRRDRAVDSLLTATMLADRSEDCVAIARSELSDEVDAHHALIVSFGLACALGSDSEEAIAFFEKAARRVLTATGLDWPADERSSLYSMIAAARAAAGDDDGVESVAREWLDFLANEAERAETPEQRTVFDSHRLSAAIRAGEPERAIPALLRSERELPDDFNPPARLAVAYLEAERYDEALAAVDRALALVEGPRRLRVLGTKAEILERRGDPAAAVDVLRDALEHAQALPRSQRPQRVVELLEKRLDALAREDRS